MLWSHLLAWKMSGQIYLILNLFFYLLQVNRPLTMRKDGIQTRKRKPKNMAGDAKSLLKSHGRLHLTTVRLFFSGSESLSGAARCFDLLYACDYC